MLNIKERAKGRKTKSKIKPDKTIKVKNQTSTHMTKTKGPARESGRVEQKRKQQIPTTKSGFQATEPMTSRRLKQSSDKPKKIKRAVDSESPRTGRATRTTKPVTGNIGEIKTSTKKPIIDTQKRTGKVKGNIGQFKTEGKSKIAEVDLSKREKFKTKQVTGNRPGAVDTSGPSIVDKSKRGKPTSRLDKIKTRAKMVMDNIARDADNLYSNPEMKKLRRKRGGQLRGMGKALRGGGKVSRG